METEIKFKVKNKQEIIKRLKEMGAKEVSKAKEVDYFFDTSSQELAQKGELVRLRKTGEKVVLTVKGPMILSEFKKREELNAVLDGGQKSFKEAKKFLELMGFKGSFGKEKKRHIFHYKGLDLCIDQLPFLGHYLEIEGNERKIRSFITEIGFDRNSAIKEPYMQLFSFWCAIHQDTLSKLSIPIALNFESERQYRRLAATTV